jgi:four helix bundle protein
MSEVGCRSSGFEAKVVVVRFLAYGCLVPVTRSVRFIPFFRMGNFRALSVWRRALNYSLTIYRATESFPGAERYGLTSQLRRAAVSVHSNIAEGSRRRSDGQLHYFLGVAQGSTGEIESQLEMAAALGLLDEANRTELVREAQDISRMLTGLMEYLRLRRTTGRKPQRSASHIRLPTSDS